MPISKAGANKPNPNSKKHQGNPAPLAPVSKGKQNQKNVTKQTSAKAKAKATATEKAAVASSTSGWSAYDKDGEASDSDSDSDSEYEGLDMEEDLASSTGPRAKARGIPGTSVVNGAGNNKKENARGVIYVGHLPDGFFEAQLKGYFSQFGAVTRVRVSRSRKTAKSRGYAFVEFAEAEVATIAADAMDNYLMFDRHLVCKTLDHSQLHPDTFKYANRKFRKVAWWKIDAARQATKRTPEQEQKRVERLLKKEDATRAKLVELGIDYDFPGVKAAVTGVAKKTTAPSRTPKKGKSNNKADVSAAVSTPQATPKSTKKAAASSAKKASAKANTKATTVNEDTDDMKTPKRSTRALAQKRGAHTDLKAPEEVDAPATTGKTPPLRRKTRALATAMTPAGKGTKKVAAAKGAKTAPVNKTKARR